MDGYLRIRTKIDNKSLEKDLKQAEKELLKLKNQEDRLSNQKIKIDIEFSKYDKAVDNLMESYKKDLAKATTPEQVDFVNVSQDWAIENLNKKYEDVLFNYEKINRKIEDNKKSQQEWNDKIKITKEELEKIKKPINIGEEQKVQKNNFNNLTKSAKRFAFSLISIGSIYSLLSKASSSYMATDEHTTKQMEANWIGLGAILSPVIEMIMKLLKKAVTSILYFMSVLTGTNFIAKANEAVLKNQKKGMDDLSKSTKKATKSLLAFDEANVLLDTSNKDKTQDIDTSVLFDVNDISESARSAIEKIAKALQPVYEIVKDIIKWCLDNPEVILGMLGAGALLKALSSIIGLAGTGGAIGTGLAGLLGILLAIASIGIIYINIKRIGTANDELQETLEILNGMGDSVDTANANQNNLYKDFIKNEKNGQESIRKMSDGLLNQIDNLSNNNEKIEDTIDNLGVYEKAIWNATNATTTQADVMKNNTRSIFRNATSLIVAEKQGKLTKEQSEKLTKQIMKLTTETDIATLSTEELAAKYQITTGEADLMKRSIGNLAEMQLDYMKNTYGSTKETEDLTKAINKIPDYKKIIVDTDTTQATNKINSLFDVLGYNASILIGAAGAGIKFKKAATGAIVNNPGKGVPITPQVVGGEAGPEGILPLTDPNAMARLGQEIGRWITINNIINNNIDGRRLNRILATSKGTSEIASNG